MHTLRAAALAARLGRPAAALSALTLAGLGLTTSAQAQTTQFSDRTLFNTAAAAGLTTFTFDNSTSTNSTKQFGGGMNVSGVGFAAPNLYAIDPSLGYGNPFGGHQYLYADALTVTLPAGTTAFGADFSNFFGSSGAVFTVVVNGSTSYTFTAPGGAGNGASSAFTGFTSSTPITSLSFSGGSPYGLALGNVGFKAGAPVPGVPEPSAPISLGVGVLGLAGLAAARRRKSAALGL